MCGDVVGGVELSFSYFEACAQGVGRRADDSPLLFCPCAAARLAARAPPPSNQAPAWLRRSHRAPVLTGNCAMAVEAGRCEAFKPDNNEAKIMNYAAQLANWRSPITAWIASMCAFTRQPFPIPRPAADGVRAHASGGRRRASRRQICARTSRWPTTSSSLFSSTSPNGNTCVPEPLGRGGASRAMFAGGVG